MPFENPYTFVNPMSGPMRIRIDEYEFTLQPGESKAVHNLTGREMMSVEMLMPDSATVEPITVEFSEPFP